jgi:AraC family transcriptional regulator of adaptative response/methylated-DNA-[protein]-cysteine methyltransferase
LNNPDYRRIEQAILFIEQQALGQPSLEEVAEHVGLSPFHFQRMFKRWAGVSPKRFLQYLTVENAKRMLRDSASVLDTSLEVGLSGPGRLHDLFVNIEAVTPGEYKRLGKGLVIGYGFHSTPFGECLIASTSRGICFLGFVEDEIGREAGMKSLQETWPDALLQESPQTASSEVKRIFSPTPHAGEEPIKLLLHGTNFQLKVWQALLRIPRGVVTSYGALTDAVERPGASRAVGNAVGKNPIAYLIPCHRVLRASGDIGGYRWGTPRKRAILALEAAHHQTLW